jgi:hypothetical protein
VAVSQIAAKTRKRRRVEDVAVFTANPEVEVGVIDRESFRQEPVVD